MSYGKLCGAPIELSTSINQNPVITVTCDKYHGHDGPHGKTFYHVIPVSDRPNFPDNLRVGNIQWRDEQLKSR